MAQPINRMPSDPREILALAWRRKWVILAPFLVFGACAAILARHLPSVYRASTVILVERAEVPEEYVRSVTTTRIEDRLATINQQILSRTRLESVIQQLNLYPDERVAQPMDAVIEKMRSAIDVQVRRADSFSVFYRGTDPAVVRDVTNRLAALYIEENSKVREEQAAGTAEFLETQLAALKQTLTEQERQVRQFKERYMGELPQQQEANLRALDRLQLQSQSVADQIRAAEERRLLMHVQLAQMPLTTEVTTRTYRPLAGEGEGARGGTRTPVVVPARDPLAVRLDEARNVLTQLRARYTDAHPDVLRAKRHIEELEAQASSTAPTAGSAAASVSSEGPSSAAPGASPAARLVPVDAIQQVPNPAHAQLTAQIASTDREVAALRENAAQLAAQIRGIQKRVENVPQLEQQLRELTRDYDNTQKTYDQLLSKRLEAQLAENLEKRQKGEQFRVLDPATTPQTPYKPDRALIVAFGLALGLGLGALLAYGLEALDHRVRDVRDLKGLLPKVAVLGGVPVIERTRAHRRRRVVTGAVGAGVALAGTSVVLLVLRFADRLVRASMFDLLLR